MSSNFQAMMIPFFAMAWWYLAVKPIEFILVACLKWLFPSLQCIGNKRVFGIDIPILRNVAHSNAQPYQEQGNHSKTQQAKAVSEKELNISYIIPKGVNNGF